MRVDGLAIGGVLAHCMHRVKNVGVLECAIELEHRSNTERGGKTDVGG